MDNFQTQMKNFQTLGNNAGNHFFKLLDKKDYKGIGGLFGQDSVMSFEGNNRKGPKPILELLQMWNKTYTQTQHKFECDTLPCPDDSRLIFIAGRRLDNKHKDMLSGILFSCTIIVKKSNGKFWFSNLIYRGEKNSLNIPSKNLEIGKKLAEQYYKIYDKDHKGLGGIYNEKTILKYEKEFLRGAQMIMCKLTKGASGKIEEEKKIKLPFRSVTFSKVAHKILLLDVHPGGGSNCLIVHVSGMLAPDGSNQGVKFGEVFIFQKGKDGFKAVVQVFRQIY